MADDDEVDAGAEALAARMLERTEEFAAAVSARIHALVPVYAERVPLPELHRSVAEHFRVIFDGLLDPSLDGNAPADLAGRERAAEGVPMSAVFEGYQIALAYIWESLAESAERDEVAWRVALRAASALWRTRSVPGSTMAAPPTKLREGCMCTRTRCGTGCGGWRRGLGARSRTRGMWPS